MNKNRLAIMLLVVILISTTVAYGLNIDLPKPTREFYINDFANLINEEVEQNILKVNLNYEKTKEKPQIVVVTVNNMKGLDENTYAVKLFEEWEIGNKGYDNGLLLLLALEERRIKIEVGYGLEGAITDSRTGRILDEALDYLSEGDYSTGIENIFYNLAQEVNEEYGYDNEDIFDDIDINNSYDSSSNVGSLFRLILLIIVIIIINGLGGGRSRRRGNIFMPIILPRFTNFGSGTHRGGGFGNGGFGGGGFGGGSFGGGGRSGGGGAGRGF